MDPRAVIRVLLAEQGFVTNRDVAGRLSMSRQAAHKHLRALVDRGELVSEGKGRGTRYRAPKHAARHFRFQTEGLEEDRVWTKLTEEVLEFGDLSANAASVFSYAVTELVNNAVDHSGSSTVEVVATRSEPRLVIEVIDEGIGVFEHVRFEMGLQSEMEALQELSKGKTTTMPDRHTGEGVFFVSKAADFFRLESGTLAWIVDNERDDVAVASVEPPRTGTRARFEADPTTARDLTALFDEYTDNYEFTRTRTRIKLFAIGVRFVSRSEAKRLLHGLEKFQRIALDFHGVEAVGQGFADEVFRVWARAHPDIEVVPIRMSESVAFMVERARR